MKQFLFLLQKHGWPLLTLYHSTLPMLVSIPLYHLYWDMFTSLLAQGEFWPIFVLFSQGFLNNMGEDFLWSIITLLGTSAQSHSLEHGKGKSMWGTCSMKAKSPGWDRGQLLGAHLTKCWLLRKRNSLQMQLSVAGTASIILGAGNVLQAWWSEVENSTSLHLRDAYAMSWLPFAENIFQFAWL